MNGGKNTAKVVQKEMLIPLISPSLSPVLSTVYVSATVSFDVLLFSTCISFIVWCHTASELLEAICLQLGATKTKYLELLLVPQLCSLTLRLKHSETDHSTVSYFLHLASIRCPVSETIVTLKHTKVKTLSIIISYI